MFIFFIVIMNFMYTLQYHSLSPISFFSITCDRFIAHINYAKISYIQCVEFLLILACNLIYPPILSYLFLSILCFISSNSFFRFTLSYLVHSMTLILILIHLVFYLTLFFTSSYLILSYLILSNLILSYLIISMTIKAIS